jgi:Uma2 family endonuclease
MATVHKTHEQHFRLSLIDWPTYVMYSDGLWDRHVRVTYDQGEMEFMTVSSEHERGKKLLGRLVDALTEELDIDSASAGSMTCRREELLRGLEPDECWWIANELAVRGRFDIDLEEDPPPDLALEVEISRSALNRMAIYAALRVSEVWRYDGQVLRFFGLTDAGDDMELEQSRAFPLLRPADLMPFLRQAEGESETKLLQRFRQCVREHFDH